MRENILKFENLISGIFPLIFLTLAGILFTIKTNGFQFRNFFKALKFSLFSGKEKNQKSSSFGAICNSLAATVGTGNIAGVAAAISMGGAGAVFWMILSSFIGMAVKSSEIVLAVIFRKKQNGIFCGSPMYYIKFGLGKFFTPLAYIFAFNGIISAFTTGNITQVNSCVYLAENHFLLKLFLGLLFFVLTAFIIVGGAEKITHFTTAVLPLMALLYIALCMGVIIKNSNALPYVFKNILKGAFSPRAVTGGVTGSFFNTLLIGAKKGIFSNEAGIGTAGIAHAAVAEAKPSTQALFGIFEVFTDTVLICGLTALTILSSGVIIDYNKIASSELVGKSLSVLYGNFANVSLTIMLCLFGISSVIGWAAYGIEFAKFLFGKVGEKFFICIYPFFCILGAIIRVEFAWRLAEFFNGLMLCINLFAVLMLFDRALPALKGKTNETENRKITKHTFGK